jgi:hypothetical protein
MSLISNTCFGGTVTSIEALYSQCPRKPCSILLFQPKGRRLVKVFGVKSKNISAPFSVLRSGYVNAVLSDLYTPILNE